MATVDRNIGVGESSLRNWVRQAEIDAGRGPAGVPTTSERVKIQELQRKLRDVERERDFLKKAEAFFAKERESTKRDGSWRYSRLPVSKSGEAWVKGKRSGRAGR